MATCGAKAPCCHVGYPHRHCEHCDVVVQAFMYAQPHYQPYWWGGTTTLQSALSNQTLQQQPLAALNHFHSEAK